VSPVLPDDDDTIINKSELHDLAHQLAGSFWQDKQIFKLFNSSDVEYMLSVCFKKLKVTEFDHSELLLDTCQQTNNHPLENHQIYTCS